LSDERTAQKAKKHFFHSVSADAQYACVCFLASSKTEQVPISRFFERHANYGSFFFDEAITVSNTWETELHLCFYQLLHTSANVQSESRSEIEWGGHE
jgi:hypothetical protein